MKEISAGLQEHLKEPLTTVAELIRLTRTDGVVLGMTSHDRDLVVDGVVYKADGAFSPGRLDQEAKLSANNYDVSGFLDSAVLSEADLSKGLYDQARVDVFLCDWADLSLGVVHVRRGWLGEVSLRDNQYVTRLRGLHDLLKQKVGEVYTPECRFSLGDGRCGVDLAARTVAGTVTGLASRMAFSDYTRTEASGFFNDAVLTWTSGANAGATMDVRGWDADSLQFTLWLPMTEAIAVGDAYTVAPGCDRRFSTCREKFANGANYGGFPYLPGIGKLLEYPDGA